MTCFLTSSPCIVGGNHFNPANDFVAELKNALPELPGGLLYGRSSTNCEAGFTGIERYVDAHDNTLNKVYYEEKTKG